MSHSYMNEHDYHHRYCAGRERSGFAKFLRVAFYILLAVIIIDAGLWVLGAALGLAIGLFSLALVLAPVILVFWLCWQLIKAIFY